MKAKTNTQKFLSSNEQYRIIKSDNYGVIKLYAIHYESSFYDLAYTIYNDCFNYLNISTPLKCEVIFRRRRSCVYYFTIKNCHSIEDVLKELSEQLKL